MANYSVVNVDNNDVSDSSGEETLDVEWSSGLAPGAQIVVYARGDLNYVNAFYSRMLDELQSGAQPDLHQASMSFSAGEISDETDDDIVTVHGLFTAMQAYGVSLFAASGDEGAYGNDEGQVEVLYPASEALATGVGGTTLDLTTGDAIYVYHFDLGYEYVYDASDPDNGVYLYDFASQTFFYTSPSFPFPYLYDFTLNAVLYYYPGTNKAGHYTTNPCYFYNFATGKIITK